MKTENEYKTVEQQLLDAGYVVSPNNIFSLPGKGWYPSCQGKLEPKAFQEIRTSDNRIYIFRTHTPKNPGNTILNVFENNASYWYEVKTALEKMEEYLKENGKVSEPGLPAYLHGD